MIFLKNWSGFARVAAIYYTYSSGKIIGWISDDHAVLLEFGTPQEADIPKTAERTGEDQGKTGELDG